MGRGGRSKARACEVNPNVLHRWRREPRDSPAGRDVPQSVQPLVTKAFSPQDHGISIHRKLLRNGDIGLAGSGGQNDTAPQSHLLWVPCAAVHCWSFSRSTSTVTQRTVSKACQAADEDKLLPAARSFLSSARSSRTETGGRPRVFNGLRTETLKKAQTCAALAPVTSEVAGSSPVVPAILFSSFQPVVRDDGSGPSGVGLRGLQTLVLGSLGTGLVRLAHAQVHARQLIMRSGLTRVKLDAA